MVDDTMKTERPESRTAGLNDDAIATQASLLEDFRKLGIRPGDILFVHSSLKSIGSIDNGAAAVIDALKDALTPNGLLLMPSFNLNTPVDVNARALRWNINTSPSTVGWLTEFFRTLPGTFRSDHYSHSVAAWGNNAESFVGEHLSQEGPGSTWDRKPWGKTFGYRSPMYKAYASDGRLLMLGVDYGSSTYGHFIETLYWRELTSKTPDAPFPGINRKILGEFWDRSGNVKFGRVGNAECRLFSIKAYIDTLFAEVMQHPELYVR